MPDPAALPFRSASAHQRHESAGEWLLRISLAGVPGLDSYKMYELGDCQSGSPIRDANSRSAPDVRRSSRPRCMTVSRTWG